METKSPLTINKTVLARTNEMKVVKQLLTDGWYKNPASPQNSFFKRRKNYEIIIDGATHPMWKVIVKPINKQFDEQDWKLAKDLESLKNLGSARNRKLYISNKNKAEISHMIKEMFRSGSNLIYSDSFIIIRQGRSFKLFKTAASLDLVAKQDGLYSGTKRIL